MYYIICTFVITDDTAPNGDGASVIATVHLQTPYSYGTRLLRVKFTSDLNMSFTTLPCRPIWMGVARCETFPTYVGKCCFATERKTLPLT